MPVPINLNPVNTLNGLNLDSSQLEAFFAARDGQRSSLWTSEDVAVCRGSRRASRMLKLVVLSPHRDDAVFSLAIALCRWRNLPIHILVANFFTCSSYGPHAINRSDHRENLTAWISEQRKREDHRALSMIDQRIRIRSAGLLDAPLRLAVPASAVCDLGVAAVGEIDIKSLSIEIVKLSHGAAVIAPLGLGGHVDHLSVAKAAAQATHGQQLAFYEDLPYAAWTPETEILRRVRETMQETGAQMRPRIVRQGCNVRGKRRLVNQYRTQITESEASSIAAFAARYQVGERIWIPRHSRLWNSF